MGLTDSLLSELQYEAATTRKMLERVPEEHFDWKPHEKSMTLKVLAMHVAEMLGWMKPTLTQPELDFAKGYEQPPLPLPKYLDDTAESSARDIFKNSKVNFAVAVVITDSNGNRTSY